MDERFTSKRVLELLFDDDFELLDGCSSDKDCSEGPSYLGNDELQLEELDALAREVTSADMAIALMEVIVMKVKMMESLCLLCFLEMRMKVRLK